MQLGTFNASVLASELHNSPISDKTSGAEYLNQFDGRLVAKISRLSRPGFRGLKYPDQG
jgi:hypothetical protein